MKQRMVVRVLNTSKKQNHSKAMQLIVAVQGVESVSLQGDNKDHILITGEGIDAVQMTTLLRKKLGFAELISVVPFGATESWEESSNLGRMMMMQQPFPSWQPSSTHPTYQASLPPYYLQDVRMSNEEERCVIS